MPARTVVIFRRDRGEDGDVYALMPEDRSNGLVACFTTHGHTAADYYGCIARSRPASLQEYQALKLAMERQGYVLDVRRRFSRRRERAS